MQTNNIVFKVCNMHRKKYPFCKEKLPWGLSVLQQQHHVREADDLMPSLMHAVLQIGPLIAFEAVEPAEDSK